jgi:Flp pilus assembly protein TadG
MKKTVMSSLKRAFLDQSGQAVVWITAGMIAIMGLAGLTADVGHTFVVKAQLQNGANAAAVAAAAQVYSTGSGLTDAAQQYDSLNGGANYLSFATSMTATPICLNSLLPGGTAHPQCVTSSTNPLANCGYTICNAVRVTQTASVPTTFLRVLNVNSLSVGVSALAAMGGPIVTPPGGTTGPDQNTWNVAIIEDATGSMATTDTNCTGSPSEFVCAVNAMQTILANLNPCPTGISPCTQASAKTRVALFSFPNMVTSEIPKFYAAGCSPDLSSYTTPMPYQVYTLPKENLTSYKPLSYTPAGGATWTASYEFTPINTLDGDANGFVSDYYQVGNTATGGLNPNSTLVRLVGYGPNGSGGTSTATPCLPIAPAGIALNGATGSGSNNSIVNTVKVGEGITYYAAVIYAAQAALTAEATAYPGSSNAIIFLSDGQANLQWIYFPPGGLKQTPSANTQAVNTITDATKGYSALNTAINHGAKVASGLSSPNQEGTAPISGVYPDFFDECQQAIAAAQYAANVGPKAPNVAGTGGAGQASRVYSIAYGSEQTGCGSGPVDNHNDVTLVSLGTLNQSFSSVSALSPCVTMENIASDLDWFFSDYMQSGSNVSTTCIDNAHPVSSMMGIGEAIAASFTNSRLLPAGTT